MSAPQSKGPSPSPPLAAASHADRPKTSAERSARRAAEHAERVGKRVGELWGVSRKRAGRAAERVGQSLRRGAADIVPPAIGNVDALLPQVDLPELSASEPLPTLARRLDREGDLWRGLALRALSRAGWADRFTQAVALLSAIACMALAAVAALAALLGGEDSTGRSLLLATGATVVVAGAAVVAWSAAGVRRAQHQLAHEASERACRTEGALRLVAAALASQPLGPEPLRAALERLSGAGSGLPSPYPQSQPPPSP